MNKYIDVRGPHPVYIQGQHAVLLEGAKRDITVEEAEELIERMKLNKVVDIRKYTD